MLLAQTDLRALTVFRSVVEHKSFLGAQIALGLSQSAVSFHIKALEERLGFTLCRRGRSGFELTDRGAIVHEKSKTLFLELNAFESDVGTLRNQIAGTLRLGLVDNTVTDPDLQIAKIIARISERAPEGRIEIVIGAPDTLLAEIANGGIDVAILPETQSYLGIRFSPLHAETHSLYCGRKHPLFAIPDRDLTTARIEAHAFVVRPYANMRELQHFAGARSQATASNMEAQVMFVMSGQFIGYLPDHYARLWFERGEFRALLQAETQIASPFVMATRAAEKPSTILDLFVRELVGLASEKLHRKAAQS